METYSAIAIALGVLSIILLIILYFKKKKIDLLQNKIENTTKLIDERLALADKYSKTLASVADQTFEAVIITNKNGFIEYGEQFEAWKRMGFIDEKKVYFESQGNKNFPSPTIQQLEKAAESYKLEK